MLNVMHAERKKDMGGLFHGDDNAAIGGEGEGAGVVDFADEVVLLTGGGIGGEGDDD